MRAACKDRDDLFFHPDGERDPSRSLRDVEAKKVCAICPVVAQCLTHSLATPEVYGVWGGLTEEEREPLIALSDSSCVDGLESLVNNYR